MTAAEVAAELAVSTRTVARWAKAGEIDVVVLPSGRRRYRRGDVEALLQPTPTAVTA